MKKSIKFISACLSALMLTSIAFSACGEEEKKEVGIDAATPVVADNSQNHVYSVSESSEWFIQNGTTKYKVILPDTPSVVMDSAVDELLTLTNEATGISLSTVSASEALNGETIKNGANDRFISLGKNPLSEAAGLADTTGLGTDGYKIVTKDNNIYVIGEDYGTLNGVYGLLNLYFNYEYFYKNTYSLTKTTDAKLLDCDIKEIPDFAHRAGGYGTMWQDDQSIRRYRMRIYSHQFVPVNGAIFHNAFSYLPYTVHGTDHAAWYNSTGDQVCYTAHGDETEYAAMVAETVKQMKYALSDERYLDREMITFSILDNTNSCGCDACNDSFTKYGAESAAIIVFLNDVNREIRAWFADESAEGGKAYARDLKICFFAYFKYVKAPVDYDAATGEYTDKGLKCDDGVCALIAPIGADYTVDFDAPENEDTKGVMLGWSAVSNDIATWYYDTLYVSTNNHYVFYNTFNGYQNRFKYAYNIGSIWMFNEGQDMTYGGQGAFNSLKMYISSRLAWNVNEDWQDMMDRYFANFYGEGADTMYTLFGEMKARAQYSKEYLNAAGDCYAQWDRAEYWPKQTLIRWRGLIDRAIADIQPMQATDKAAYDRCYEHIIYERMYLDYMLCTMYEGTLTETQFAQFRAEFIADAALSGNTGAQKVAQSWTQN